MLSIFLSFLVNLGGIMRSIQDRVKRQSMKFNLDCSKCQVRRKDFVCKTMIKENPYTPRTLMLAEQLLLPTSL